jgi:hypothetical protein
MIGTVAVSVAVTAAEQPAEREMAWTEVQATKGGAEGTRTPDPHTASVVRYQLRHGPLHARSPGTRQWYTSPTAPGRSGGPVS